LARGSVRSREFSVTFSVEANVGQSGKSNGINLKCLVESLG
jgi:hypothetical protein